MYQTLLAIVIAAIIILWIAELKMDDIRSQASWDKREAERRIRELEDR